MVPSDVVCAGPLLTRRPSVNRSCSGAKPIPPRDPCVSGSTEAPVPSGRIETMPAAPTGTRMRGSRGVPAQRERPTSRGQALSGLPVQACASEATRTVSNSVSSRAASPPPGNS